MTLPIDTIVHGLCLDVLKTFPDASVDAVVSDPPYGIGTKEPSAEEITAYLKGADLDTGGDFMSKDWEIPSVPVWQECFRVLKPGGYVLSFASTRTWDIMSVGLRAAGFENRDTISSLFASPALLWMHSQGFPKSLNVSKAIDKLRGVSSSKEQEIAAYLRERREALGLTRAQVDGEVFGGSTRYAFVEGRNNEDGKFRIYLPTPEEWVKLKVVLKLDARFDKYIKAAIPSREDRALADGGKADLVSLEEGSYGYQQTGERWEKNQRVTKPATDLAKKWEGFGTALKPAWEPVLCFRKPIAEATLAAQVLATGTGAINIDGCRVKHSSPEDFEKHKAGVEAIKARGGSMKDSWKNSSDLSGASAVKTEGRWPANLVVTHSEGCRQVGSKTVDAPVINRFTDGMKPFGEGAGHPYESSGGGEEEVAVYECVEGCPAKAMDEQSGVLKNGGHLRASATEKIQNDIYGSGFTRVQDTNFAGDRGGASRFFTQFIPDAPFFYTGKASKREKNDGVIEGKFLTGFMSVKDNLKAEEQALLEAEWPKDYPSPKTPIMGGMMKDFSEALLKLFVEVKADSNQHVTVKPLALMRWLVRMVTPKKVLICPLCHGGKATLSVSGVRKPVPSEEEGTACVFDSVSKQDSGARGEAASPLSLSYLREDFHSEVGREQTLLHQVPVEGSDASESHLPSMQPRVSPQGPDASTLFSSVLTSGETETPSEVHRVRNPIPLEAPQQKSVLFQEVLCGIHGEGEKEGGLSYGEGVPSPLDAGSSDGNAERLPAGTPASDGATLGSKPTGRRGGASSKRDQNRQSSRKPGGVAEGSTRCSTQEPPETNSVSSLQRPHSGEGECKSCGSRLVWAPGIVLDPYCGSGTTCVAAVAEGLHFIGIERDSFSVKTAQARVGKGLQEAQGREAAQAASQFIANIPEDDDPITP